MGNNESWTGTINKHPVCSQQLRCWLASHPDGDGGPHTGHLLPWQRARPSISWKEAVRGVRESDVTPEGNL